MPNNGIGRALNTNFIYYQTNKDGKMEFTTFNPYTTLPPQIAHLLNHGSVV